METLVLNQRIPRIADLPLYQLRYDAVYLCLDHGGFRCDQLGQPRPEPDGLRRAIAAQLCTVFLRHGVYHLRSWHLALLDSLHLETVHSL